MKVFRISASVAAIIAASTLISFPAAAQEQETPVLNLVTSDFVDRLRADQLTKGVPDGQSLLLRSASTLPSSLSLGKRTWAVGIIYPQILAVYNSALPFSQNNSAMWAGR